MKKLNCVFVEGARTLLFYHPCSYDKKCHYETNRSWANLNCLHGESTRRLSLQNPNANNKKHPKLTKKPELTFPAEQKEAGWSDVFLIPWYTVYLNTAQACW